MGADSRTSTGTYIAVRVADKITQVHDRIWICRSGSAADTQALTDYIRHYLGQLAIETGRAPTVKTAAHLMKRLIYENKDNLMAGVIVGGWDSVEGGSVYNIPLGGTMMKMPFGEYNMIVRFEFICTAYRDLDLCWTITPDSYFLYLLYYCYSQRQSQPLVEAARRTFMASWITSTGME